MFAYGQQTLDIAIIGTAHYFQEEYQSLQDFEAAQQYIIDFAPDLFCIEAIPTYDTLSIQEVFAGSIRKAAYLADTLSMLGLMPKSDGVPIMTASLSDSSQISDQSQQALLGAQYFLDFDFFNAYYKWDGLQPEDELGFLTQYASNLEHSEFRHIIFPAARELGVEQFYGIDYRQGEDLFLANNQKVLKKLLFRLKWKPLRTYLKIQKQYKKAEQEGYLIEYINGPVFLNAFSQLIDDLPAKLPKVEEAQQVKDYWLLRNQIMADRLIAAAQQQSARRVILAVGSAHVTPIQHFLVAKGHRVSTYGRYQSNTEN